MSKGKPCGHCRTCHSEIVTTVNDGVFRKGECGLCEYERYRSQPEILALLVELIEIAKSVAGNWESGSLATAVRNLNHVLHRAETTLKSERWNARTELSEALRRIVAGIEDMLLDESFQITLDCGDLLLQLATIANAAIRKADLGATC